MEAARPEAASTPLARDMREEGSEDPPPRVDRTAERSSCLDRRPTMPIHGDSSRAPSRCTRARSSHDNRRHAPANWPAPVRPRPTIREKRAIRTWRRQSPGSSPIEVQRRQHTMNRHQAIARMLRMTDDARNVVTVPVAPDKGSRRPLARQPRNSRFSTLPAALRGRGAARISKVSGTL